MPWSAGTFTRSNGSYTGATVWNQDQINGFDILSNRHDNHDQDIATGINTCLTKDGQNTPTANLSMGGYLHTNVANGTVRTNYATVGQLQDSSVLYGGTAGGTANALTLTLTPAISGYVAGQVFRFFAALSNTGAATLQINGIASPKTILSAKTGVNLLAGNIVANRFYEVLYTGSDFVLTNETPAWQTFTPAITQSGSVTFTIDYCKYFIDGKKITYQGALVATSAGTTGNAVTVSLPVNSATSGSYRVIGNATIIDVSPFTTYNLAAINTSTSTMTFHGDTSGGNNFGITPAFAIASGDLINFNVTYETA